MSIGLNQRSYYSLALPNAIIIIGVYMSGLWLIISIKKMYVGRRTVHAYYHSFNSEREYTTCAFNRTLLH